MIYPSARNYCIEESPSNRATCRICREKIMKDILRIQEFTGNTYGNANYIYYHLKCGIIKMEEDLKTLLRVIEYSKNVVGRIERRERKFEG